MLMLLTTADTGWNPELMALPLIGAHGELKEDWTTEWLPFMNINSTTSPEAAVMVSGVNLRPPSPTITLWRVAAPETVVAARASVARVREYIVIGVVFRLKEKLKFMCKVMLSKRLKKGINVEIRDGLKLFGPADE